MKQLKRKILVLGYAALFTQSMHAQPTSIEEIRLQLDTVSADSTRIQLLWAWSRMVTTSNLDSALTIIDTAIAIRNTAGYSKYDYRLLIAQGMIHSMMGEYTLAQQSHMNYLKLAEQRNDSAHMALALMNIAGLYYNQNDTQAYETYAAKSFAIHPVSPYLNLLHRARQAAFRGDFELAIELGRKVYSKSVNTPPKNWNQQVNKPLQLTAITGRMADFFVRAEQYDSALVYFDRCMHLCIKQGNHRMLSIIQGSKGKIYLQQGDLTKALEAFQSSLYHGHVVGSKQQLLEGYNNMVYAYDTLGNYQMSRLYMDSILLVKDALFSVAKSRQIEELTTRYETAKKDQQIAELETENALTQIESSKKNIWLWAIVSITCGLVFMMVVLSRTRKRRRDAMFAQKRAELEQQALRAQMNPHFLFNALSNLQSLYNEGQVEKANDLMADFGRLLRLILEHTSQQCISLTEEIEALRLYLNIEQERLDDNLRYMITLDEHIDADALMMPPLVLQPFIENAIWHGIAPKGDGTVQVAFQSVINNKLICAVQDDGIGIAASKAKGSNKHKTHKSKGIALTTERLGGEQAIVVEELPEGGTKITLQIPIEYVY